MSTCKIRYRLIKERRENSVSIPIDLIVEILSRLPSKSIARFRCVSKLWESIYQRPYFTKLFYTLSQARPRLLLAIEPAQGGAWHLYSSPEPQNPYDKSMSLVADFHMKFPTNSSQSVRFSCGYVSGLVCFSDLKISKEYNECDYKLMICNPTTRQYAILPNLTMSRRYIRSSNFLGFDPIDKEFKLLSMTHSAYDENKILTLGDGKMSWRKIECPESHKPSSRERVCIDGVLYYIAEDSDGVMIVCFDVRCEKFKFIPARFFEFYFTTLINYKGKLGGISRKEDDDTGAVELNMWVLEDVKTQEWSKYVYTLPDNKTVDIRHVFVAGVTSTGDIVLSLHYFHRENYASKPFYVFYFNPERRTMQTVEIYNRQVFDNGNRVHIFVDHVEYLKFNTMNATSISSPEEKPKPTSTSTSFKEDHHQKQDHRTFESNNKGAIYISSPEQKKCKPTRTSKKDHHQKEDRPTFQSINKFDALRYSSFIEDLNFKTMKRTSISLQEKKQPKPTRTSEEDCHQKQDHRKFESINKAKCDLSFIVFERALSLCCLTVLLLLVIMLMS